MIDISVVIPIYMNEQFIKELYSRLVLTLKKISDNFEIIFVDDGSPDSSWTLIKDLTDKEKRVVGIKFSRNFGQHKAITAGLDKSKGEWVVVMDGDLQDIPEEIIKLYNKATKEGFDVVFARRYHRRDKFTKKLSSKIFYKILGSLIDENIDSSVANFGIYSRKVIENFTKMREHSRLFPLFIKWLGFDICYIDVKHKERNSGKTAYTFSKRIKLAMDTIVSMSNKPLKISIKLGFFLSISSFLFGMILIIKYIIWGIPVQGWTSLMVSIYFLGGLLLSIGGILGVYIGKIFDEVKNRPIYIIDEIINSLNEKND